jgi:polysaccharide biosynthesis transport protein
MFLNPRALSLTTVATPEADAKSPAPRTPPRPDGPARASASIVPPRPSGIVGAAAQTPPGRPQEPLSPAPSTLQFQAQEPLKEPAARLRETVQVPAPAQSTPAANYNLPLESPWAFLQRSKAYILGGMAAAILLGLAMELTVSPRYRAASQILIGPTDLRLFDKSVTPPAQTADANVIQVESETRVLTSDRVLLRVVQREKLTDDPEFQARGGSLLGGAISTLRTAIGSTPEPAKTTDVELNALRLLQRNVSAKRTERTYVVDLVVETSDPEKSARIANAIGLAYLDEQAAARAEAVRRASDSLTSRLSEQRERVRQAEEQVERYKAEHNIVGPTGRLVDEQQLSDLNNQLSAAKARTAEANARHEQMLQLQRSGADRASTSEAVQSNTLGRLREQYATIARQEANLAAELGPRHPFVIDARAQLRNAQQQVTGEIVRIAESSRNDYERALANEHTLSRNLDALKLRAIDTSIAFVKLRELEREVDASRAVYESFLVRARETREQERLDTANVRILADAQPPQERSWPPRRLLLLLAMLALGCLGGAGLAYGLELGGRSARKPKRGASPQQSVS